MQVIQHDFTEDEEIEFVRDTAIERRSLTAVQKLHIVLETEELIDGIFAEGKNRISENNRKRNEEQNPLSSHEETEKPHNSVKKIMV